MSDFVIQNGVLKKYTGNGGDVVIPDGVTTIGPWVFSGCTSLTSITIPNGVTEISERAFQRCISLTSVAFPGGVTTIGRSAFSGCEKLTSIMIPDSVKTIGHEVFEGCTSLTSIMLPDGVLCGEEVFKDTAYFGDESNWDNGMLYSGNCLVKAKMDTLGKEVIVRDGTTTIAYGAFQLCKNLVSITIPDGVTTIGAHAFSDCNKLISITIPDSVVTIGDSAFSGCKKLTSITIPDSVTTIGCAVFSGCKNLTSITIPDSVTTIAGWAFEGCTSLASVTIPDGVTELGEKAFSGCKNLTSVTVPCSVKTIGIKAFFACDALADIRTDSKEVFDRVWKSLSKNAKLSLLRIALQCRVPNEWVLAKAKAYKKELMLCAVKENNGGMVARLLSLHKTVPLSEMDEYIKKAVESAAVTAVLLDYKAKAYSFEAQEEHEAVATEKELGLRERSVADWRKIFVFVTCEGGVKIRAYRGDDTNVIIPQKIGRHMVVAIAYGAFCECENLVSIVIPDSVRTMGEKVFCECEKLRSVTLSNSVTEIGEMAFCGCKNLTLITIPDSVTEIGDWAFQDCENLTSITIPDGVTEIGWGAFSDCTSLESITIPDSVATIGDGAFYGCKTLTIHAPAGSYAEQYAKENNIPFVAE